MTKKELNKDINDLLEMGIEWTGSYPPNEREVASKYLTEISKEIKKILKKYPIEVTIKLAELRQAWLNVEN